MRETVLVIHFIGLAMGLGTSFGFMFLGMAGSKMEVKEGRKFALNTLVLGKMGQIGLILLILSGIYLIVPYWNSLFSLPLIIAKLALVLLLIALLTAIGVHSQKVKKGNFDHLKKIQKIGPFALITALAIVVLAVLVFH